MKLLEQSLSAKIAVYLGLAAVVLLILAPLFCAPHVGFFSSQWDIGVHIAIIMRLLDGNWFMIAGDQMSEHIVAAWLPIYHGILGAHFLTTLFYFAGVPLGFAVKLVATLSIAAVPAIGINFNQKENRVWHIWVQLCYFLLVVLPALFAVGFWGAYAQIVSIPLYLLSLLLMRQQKLGLATAALLLGAWCYPDAFVFLGPVLGLWNFRLNKTMVAFGRYGLVLLAISISIVLLLVQIHRFALPGGFTEISNFALVATLLAVGSLAIVPNLRRQLNQPQVLATVLYALILMIMLAVVNVKYSTTGELPYYFKKFIVWGVLLSYVTLPELLRSFESRKKLRLLFLSLLVGNVFVASNFDSEDMMRLQSLSASWYKLSQVEIYQNYLSPINAMALKEIDLANRLRQSTSESEKVVLVVSRLNSAGDTNDMSRRIMYNSATRSLSFVSGKFRDIRLQDFLLNYSKTHSSLNSADFALVVVKQHILPPAQIHIIATDTISYEKVLRGLGAVEKSKIELERLF